MPSPQVRPHIAITEGTPSYCHHLRYTLILPSPKLYPQTANHQRYILILPSPKVYPHVAITTGTSSYLPSQQVYLHTAITTGPSSYCHHHMSVFILPSPHVRRHIWVLLPWCTLPLRLHSPFFHPVTSKQQDRLHDFGQGSLAVRH